uniref:Paired domain-containing protein n=1 Tax=Haemonchus contortus TaxID=6289 RepID=A0A7I5ECG5_HAECO
MGRTLGSRSLTEEQLAAIARGSMQGLTHAQLSEQFGVSRSTITKAIGRIKARGGPTKRASTGRPRITTPADDRKIVRASRQDPRRTSSDIMTEISTTVTPLPSQSTISRRLRDVGLHARRPEKKPLVSPKNRRARLGWACRHLHWTLDQWREVIWSDESKFVLFGTDGISFVRRPVNKRFDPKYQIPTVKHGGGLVFVWRCFSNRGMGPLHCIPTTMDQQMYVDILKKCLLPFARRMHGRKFTFQQGNDPKHRSRRVLEWLSHSMPEKFDASTGTVSPLT